MRATFPAKPLPMADAPAPPAASPPARTGEGPPPPPHPSSHGPGGSGTDRLAATVRAIGRDVDAGVAGADILELLAMAKGPMFAWLSYWPEEGFRKEDHPY